MTTKNRDDLVGLDEGAALVGRSRPMMRIYVAEGLVRSERIGGRLFLVRADCVALGLKLAQAAALKTKREASPPFRLGPSTIRA
jgi:hypothetical protein